MTAWTPEQMQQVAKYKYEMLKAEVTYHAYLYYVGGINEIGDQEYDQLFKSFEKLAEQLGLPDDRPQWREGL